MLGAPADQAQRAAKRARLLAAIGAVGDDVYPEGYLDEMRRGWRD